MNRAPIYEHYARAATIIMSTTNTTVLANNTTTTTPAPASTPAPFCFSCGFDFGHIVDGVDDRTAGALLVVLFLMGLLAIGVVSACCLHNRCCGAGEYRHLGKHSADEAAGDEEKNEK